MITLTINGAEVKVPEERTVLQAAKAMGIRIPTLCHHEALSPYGSCRLCVVEVVKDGRSRIVTSCNYPAREGMEVLTHSDKVLTHRKMLVELLLARCPETRAVRKLADELGVEKSRFPATTSNCVLCGLCVRVCEERIGVSAISFVNRGIEEQVAAPYQMSPEACIACGACASVCPTGAIKATEIDGMMRIDKFGTVSKLRKCPSCKKPYAAESHLARIGAALGPHAYLTSLCPECKRTEGSRLARMISTYQRNRPQG